MSSSCNTNNQQQQCLGSYLQLQGPPLSPISLLHSLESKNQHKQLPGFSGSLPRGESSFKQCNFATLLQPSLVSFLIVCRAKGQDKRCMKNSKMQEEMACFHLPSALASLSWFVMADYWVVVNINFGRAIRAWEWNGSLLSKKEARRVASQQVREWLSCCVRLLPSRAIKRGADSTRRMQDCGAKKSLGEIRSNVTSSRLSCCAAQH